jgi:hypothetical protein
MKFTEEVMFTVCRGFCRQGWITNWAQWAQCPGLTKPPRPRKFLARKVSDNSDEKRKLLNQTQCFVFFEFLYRTVLF